jgi:cardiolipin synthase
VNATLEQLAILGSILYAGWQILALFSIGHVLMKSRTVAGTWAWAMAMLALPFFAVPLYWIFGRRRFHGYAARLRHAHELYEEQLRERHEIVAPHRATLAGEELRYGGLLEKLSERRWSEGNAVSLLVDGEAIFEAIFRAIEQAESYVLAEFFIVKDDALGNRFRELLESKARAGVAVHLIYDEIGSHGLSKRYLRSLREAGVDVRPFHSTQGATNRFQINFRNHRKIVVCDGRIGFVGGANVGDEYLGETARYGAWRDTQVEIRGPAVLSLQMVFLSDYYWAAHDTPKVAWPAEASPRGEAKVLTLPTGPVEAVEGGTVFFLHAITKARRRLWIATPYFVVDESIRSALQMAALRGVDVRIMVPQRPDKWIPWLATFSYLGEMEAAGVRMFRYQPGFLHQKAVLVDESFAAVGTANLDNRSMRLNFEITAAVLCESFAAEVEAMLRHDFERSREVGADDLLGRPWWFKVGVKLASLASPVL